MLDKLIEYISVKEVLVMKKVLLVYVLVLVLGIVFYGALARPCFAGICVADWRCFTSSACPGECVCAKRGTEVQGRCMGASRAVDGWEILP